MTRRKMYIRGDRLRHFREARGWTQEDLAERSGVHRAVISRAEAGERRNILSNNLMMLAHTFGVRPEQLIESPPPLPESEMAMPEIEAMAKLIEGMTSAERWEAYNAIQYILWKREELDAGAHPEAARPDGEGSAG